MNTVTIQSDTYPNCRTDVCVYEVRCPGGTVILRVESGATALQTYATRAELRELGEMLLRCADEGEVLEVAA